MILQPQRLNVLFMASKETPYILTKDDQSHWHNEDPPEIRAARNPDARALVALLDNASATSRRKYSANAFVPGHTYRLIQTPLLATIKAQLPENVRTILSRGADPNGVPLNDISAYAAHFLRFRYQWGLTHEPRKEVLRHIPTLQTDPITASEIEARSKTACHFWIGTDSVPLDHYTGGDGITALEEACNHPSEEILEMVISSSPQISFWTSSGIQTDIPNSETPSSLWYRIHCVALSNMAMLITYDGFAILDSIQILCLSLAVSSTIPLPWPP
jgi:hypothetical protein